MIGGIKYFEKRYKNTDVHSKVVRFDKLVMWSRL